MEKRFVFFFIVLALVGSAFNACNSLLDPDVNDDEQEETSKSDNEKTIDEAVSNNGIEHEDASDYTWNSSDVIEITLNETTVSENDESVSVSGGKITITSAGIYSFAGTLTDGQVVVNTDDEEIVRLILNGVNINSSSSAPVYVKSASKVVIYLAENSLNFLTDGASYNYDDAEDEEPNATIFSKSDLTIFGEGSLTVNGNFNDAITSKDGLIISGGTYTINAADDGIRGKDYLVIKSGNFDVSSNGDGLKSDNDSDESLGYIYIIDGNFNIDSKGDAIAAETDVLISTCELTLKSGGGSSVSVLSSASTKGIKAGVNIIIDSGTYTISSADDAIHSNESITINNGTFAIASGDDGIHADYDLTINDGAIDISKSYEGIESAKGDITITKGIIYLVASDDGINLAGGGDSMGGPGGGMWGGAGSTISSGSYTIFINGGYIFVNANGDGIDANGSIQMTAGTVIINGPTNNGNGALDYNSSFKLTGGFLVATGSSGMAQAPGNSSTQYSVLASFNTSQKAGTLVNIQTADGTGVLTFKPEKLYQSVVFSSSELEKSTTYNIYLGGTSTGTAVDGLYTDGTYTPGTRYRSFTISGIVTSIR